MVSATPMSAEILGQGVGQPAEELFLVTPSDTDDLRFVTRAIRVGAAGDLRLFRFGTNRAVNRTRATYAALEMLRREILDIK